QLLFAPRSLHGAPRTASVVLVTLPRGLRPLGRVKEWVRWLLDGALSGRTSRRVSTRPGRVAANSLLDLAFSSGFSLLNRVTLQFFDSNHSNAPRGGSSADGLPETVEGADFLNRQASHFCGTLQGQFFSHRPHLV